MASYQKTANGKVRVRIKVGSVKRSGTFATMRQARQWATQIESDLRNQRAGIRRTTGKTTVGDLITEYMDDVVVDGKTKRNTLLFLKRELKTARLDQIDIALDDFVARRRKQGVSGVSIGIELSTLSTVLKWAYAVKNMAVDVDAGKRARSALSVRGVKTRSRRRDRIPTPEELQRLYAHWRGMKHQKIPMERIVKFALASAMRQGEICRILIEDFNPEKKTVVVRDRKDPKEKIGNDQVVPLVGDAFDLVVEAIGERTAGKIFPYNSRSVSTSFQNATKACGFPDLRFHDLRHAAITELFRKGLSIQHVAIISGHKSWENLRRYTQLGADDVFRVLNGNSDQRSDE